MDWSCDRRPSEYRRPVSVSLDARCANAKRCPFVFFALSLQNPPQKFAMQPFKNLLVVVDCDAPTVHLERTFAFAQHLQASVKLVGVVRAYDWLQRIALKRHEVFHQHMVNSYSSRLEKLAESARASGLQATTRVLAGKSSIEIIREVVRGGHDLVIKEAKGRDWHKGFFGTTGVQLLRRCPCAVWLTKPGPHSQYSNVLAAVDGCCTDAAHADLNHVVLDLATSFCKWEQSQLEVVQAWAVYGEEILKGHMQDEEYKRLIQEGHVDAVRQFEELLRKHHVDVPTAHTHLLHGDPSLVIPRFAKEAAIDVIVLGTIARSGVAGALLGNTAEAILDQVECSILAVKPADFVTPVSLVD